jgi:NAD-dependent deacetylase
MAHAKTDRIVILTGAGISAESGIATFRDPDGVWARYDIEDVATPQAFARNPRLVHEFYNGRRRALPMAQPNAAHTALAELERVWTGGRRSLTIVTQNVDDLHERAGSKNLIHMHGALNRALCQTCHTRTDCTGDLSTELACDHCQATGGLRPDVVWFGEMPYHMERIEALLREADLFVSIGTSGHVYPASGFVALARRAGAHTVELNLEPSLGVSLFHEAIHGQAGSVVPAFVKRLAG